MRKNWQERKEFEQLESDLRRERPRPRSHYLEMLATRLQGDRVTRSHRPALRFRVGFAIVMTSLLGGAAAASGGLGYANTASTHSVKAVAHVFSVANRSANPAPPRHDATPPASDAQPSDAQPSASAPVDAAAAVNATNGSVSHHGDAAHHQYVELVFICLRVHPHHPSTFVTLRVPRPVADILIARGLATLGPC